MQPIPAYIEIEELVPLMGGAIRSSDPVRSLERWLKRQGCVETVLGKSVVVVARLSEERPMLYSAWLTEFMNVARAAELDGLSGTG